MPTFDEHLAPAREQPAYWSQRTSLAFIDAIVAEMNAQGVSGAELGMADILRMGVDLWLSQSVRAHCFLPAGTFAATAALGVPVRCG